MRRRFFLFNTENHNKKGAILYFVAAGLFVFLGFAGLALDLGMLYTVKSELQNAVDASALAGASKLNGAPAGIDLAVAEAIATINKFYFSKTLVSIGSTDITFSTTRDSGYVDQAAARGNAANIRFVKAITQKTVSLMLMRAVPGIGDTRDVAAGAVAGQSPPINVVCDGLNPLTPVPFRNADGSLIPYVKGQTYILKFGGGCQNPEPTDPTGPGNFLILDFSPVTGSNSGAAEVRDLLQGGASGCIGIDDTICTKPGSATGPIEQGINSRFDPPKPNEIDYRDTDIVVENYTTYAQRGLGNGNRILPVPIVSKTKYPVFTSISQADYDIINKDRNTGKICGLYIYDIACFFIQNPVDTKGGCANVFGEFIGSCSNGGGKVDPGRGGAGGSGAPSLTRLVLYR